MRGLRGAWNGPYLDPQVDIRWPPAGPSGGPIRALRGLNWGS
jgi:hypothetical protein